MRPSQKELNDFLLDLVELLGKHFSGYFDKTKIAGGNQGISLILKHTGHGSELEIATDGGRAVFRMGEAVRDAGHAADKEKMFSAVMSDLPAILENRLYPVRGYRGGRLLASVFYRGREGSQGAEAEAEAAADFRTRHPDCDRVVVRKWTGPERIFTD